nr:hypothetical protein GCM10020185_10710 [Pseudomonas brassicacearum subsp. brassicacearum]
MSFAEQLTRLQVFLDADELHEEALDYVAAHGYLTALSICAETVPDREWIDALFAEEPHYSDEAQRAEIEATLVGLKAHIARQLASDEEFELPCDLDLGDDPDDSELRGWCIGFMEGVFLREAAWFETAEEEVSEMLLPIMVGSGLFDEQPEFFRHRRRRQPDGRHDCPDPRSPHGPVPAVQRTGRETGDPQASPPLSDRVPSPVGNRPLILRYVLLAIGWLSVALGGHRHLRSRTAHHPFPAPGGGLFRPQLAALLPMAGRTSPPRPVDPRLPQRQRHPAQG